MYKIVDGKMITAAVVIIDDDGYILGCHATGRPVNWGYDFPKGCVEEGETDLEGALRELQEETGLRIAAGEGQIIDAGIHHHNKEKNIHIFIYKVKEMPDINTLKCESYFERKGKEVPEVDGYKIISRKERWVFNGVLQDKFDLIDEKARTLPDKGDLEKEIDKTAEDYFEYPTQSFFKDSLKRFFLMGKSSAIDDAAEWLKKNARSYLKGEYNEFHRTVEYDGYNTTAMVEAFEKEMRG